MHNLTFNLFSSLKQSCQLYSNVNYDTETNVKCMPAKPLCKQHLCHSSNKNSWEWLMLWQKWASTDRKLLPDWETSQQHHTQTWGWRNVRKHTGSWAFYHKLLHDGNPAKENLRNCDTECVSTICLCGRLIKEQGTSLLTWWQISAPSLRNCATGD